MSKNIIFVGLDCSLTKQIASSIANKLDLFFLDVNDLISYNLQDENRVINTAGQDYYNKQIFKLATSVITYEDTIVNMPYDLLLQDNIFFAINSFTQIIFLDYSHELLTKQNKQSGELDITLIVEDELRKELTTKCHQSISVDNLEFDQICSKILEKIKNKS